MKLGALSKLATDVEASSRMRIVDIESGNVLADVDGNECYIDFMSNDGAIGRKLEKDRYSAQVRQVRSGRETGDDGEDMIKFQIKTVIALAAGWYFGKPATKQEPDGAEPFSPKAAATLFENPEYRWLVKQAYVFVTNPGNFIQRSSKT